MTLTKRIVLQRTVIAGLTSNAFYRSVQPATNFPIGDVFYCLIDGVGDNKLRIDISQIGKISDPGAHANKRQFNAYETTAPISEVFTQWEMGAKPGVLFVFGQADRGGQQIGILGVIDMLSLPQLNLGTFFITWKKLYHLPKMFVSQTILGTDETQIAFAGYVEKYQWYDAAQNVHNSDEGASYASQKAIILGLHSLCPVTLKPEGESIEQMTSLTSTKEGSNYLGIETFELNNSYSFYQMFYNLEITFVWQETHYGAIRLYDMQKFTSSQKQMDTRKFDNTIDEDPKFVAIDIDEKCKDPLEFPNCQNGKQNIVTKMPIGMTPPSRPPCSTHEIDRSLCYLLLNWFFHVFDPHLMVPPPSNDLTVYELKFGMDTRYVEPWLECTPHQYFNDNLKGYIHGAYFKYMMHRNSLESHLTVSPVILTSMYADKCYWTHQLFELVAGDGNESFERVILTLPEYVTSVSHGQQSLDWASKGGQIAVKTTDIALLEAKGTLWLATQLTNSQFYQATVYITFGSYCDDQSFYTIEPFQVVYLSLYDHMPFEYYFAEIKGLNAQIDAACKNDKTSYQSQYIDENGKEDPIMIELEDQGLIKRDSDKIVVFALKKSFRLQTFRIQQSVTYSEYMLTGISSTIEIRIICYVEGHQVPPEAQPSNIFDIISYQRLIQGTEILKPYQISVKPVPTQACGYETVSQLFQQDARDKRIPQFIMFEDNGIEQSIRLFNPVQGQSQISAEEVFQRFTFEVVHSTLNSDLEYFISTIADLDGKQRIRKKGYIEDSNNRSFKLKPKVELPFVFQLQDEKSMNKAPYFDQREMQLVKQIEVEPGTVETIFLPPVMDYDKDRVEVLVQVDGVELQEKDASSQEMTALPITDQNKCTEQACFMTFSKKKLEITIKYPKDYLSRKRSSFAGGRPQPGSKNEDDFTAPAYDSDGNLVQIQKSPSDYFQGMMPGLDDQVGGESHEIQIILDDGTQMVDYFIKVIVGSDDQSIQINPPITATGWITDSREIVPPQDIEQESEKPLEKVEQEVEESESNVIDKIQTDDDFDFLEYMDRQNQKQQKMREQKRTMKFDPDLVPWPQIKEPISVDGRVKVKFQNEVIYTKCVACEVADDRQTLRRLRETREYSKPEKFYKTKSYKEMLKKNKNIVMKIIPSSSSNNQQLDFDWEISSIETTGIEIKLEFKRPELVSTYRDKDILKIMFLNTHTFMQDLYGSTKNILPSGFEIVQEIPMLVNQVDQVIIKNVDKTDVQQSSQTLITAVPMISFFFNYSMQLLWGSINSLLIIAHLPIINVVMPSNVRTHYEILISVVTFDIFGYWIEGVNFGQTETEAYRPDLEYLRYDSLNILTNMFSTHVFLVLLSVQTVLAFVLKVTCLLHFKCCRKCRSKEVWHNFVQGVLRIFLTQFLEILLSSIIGLELLKLDTPLTQVDKYTLLTNYFYIGALILFTLLLCWFVFWRMRTLVSLKKTRDMLELLQLFKIIRQKEKPEEGQRYAYNRIRRSMTNARIDQFEKEQTLKISQLVKRTETTRNNIALVIAKTKDHKRMMEERSVNREYEDYCKKLKGLQREFVQEKQSFKKYEIFFEDKKLTNLGLYESFFFILRRFIFILSALFLFKQNLVIVAVAIYSASSFLNLAYFLSVQPMIDQRRNWIESLNEIFVLNTGYYALLLLDESMSREEIFNLGRVIKATIYLDVAFNIIIIFASFYLQTRQKCQEYWFKKFNKKLHKAHKKAKKEMKRRRKSIDYKQRFAADQSKTIKAYDAPLKFKLIAKECELLDMSQLSSIECKSDPIGEQTQQDSSKYNLNNLSQANLALNTQRETPRDPFDSDGEGEQLLFNKLNKQHKFREMRRRKTIGPFDESSDSGEEQKVTKDTITLKPSRPSHISKYLSNEVDLIQGIDVEHTRYQTGYRAGRKQRNNSMRIVQSELQNCDMETSRVHRQHRSYDDEDSNCENHIVLGLNRIELYSPQDNIDINFDYQQPQVHDQLFLSNVDYSKVKPRDSQQRIVKEQQDLNSSNETEETIQAEYNMHKKKRTQSGQVKEERKEPYPKEKK